MQDNIILSIFGNSFVIVMHNYRLTQVIATYKTDQRLKRVNVEYRININSFKLAGGWDHVGSHQLHVKME